ncbi:hypothetical protein ACIO3O_34735 [Streptomyces sp. NPDC087440]|uniref:hypothetical protein n=1 Tax=Streptomyces sp. NPDC087440 TaxID=3365790 RepID=UPI0037F7D2B2
MLITVMSQNVQLDAPSEGRWTHLASGVRALGPDLLLLQEVNWLTTETAVTAAESELGMRLAVAPSRNIPVAVAWNPDTVDVLGVETKYSTTDLHHGYCAPRVRPRGIDLPVPLVVISTHLTPYATQAAAQEAQLLCARAYKHGGLGLIGGDINHLPLGDPEPDWERVPPYNRASRCLRRSTTSEPWQGDRTVGQVLQDADLTDVAAHLADLHNDPALRQITGTAGLLRTDQTHVTPALVPALTSYRTIDPGGYSDHWGTLCTLDLGRINAGSLREYS